jgi:alpha-tubulin suppressor-like RCC1 family protein
MRATGDRRGGVRWVLVGLLAAVGLMVAALPVTAADVPYAWGDNTYGQLGDGTWIDRSLPVPVQSPAGAVAVSAGGGHALVLMSDGSLRAWGFNEYGQLGDGTRVDRFSSVPVVNLANVVAMSAGAYSSFAVRGDGTVWGWGANFYGELGAGPGIETRRRTPAQVLYLTDAIDVDTTLGHTLALLRDGTVRAWGHNGYGELGDGTMNQRYTAVPVSGLTGVVAVAAGQYHSLALRSDGTVWAWGRNISGELGVGSAVERSLTPIQISDLTGVVDIDAGSGHSLALKSDGTVWAWGANGTGQIGDGGTVTRFVPTHVSGLTSAVAIAAGSIHTLALLQDGTVWAWGANFSGELGDGTTTDRHSPTRMQTALHWGAISAGGGYSLAIIRDGTSPTISIVAPRRGSWSEVLTRIAGTAADEAGGSGLRDVTVRLRRNRDSSPISNRYWKPGTGWVLAPATAVLPVSGLATWEVTTGLPAGANLPEGQYIIYATATDHAANFRTVTSYFLVDTQPPASVTFTSPKNGEIVSNLAGITGTAADAPGSLGIRRVVVRLRQLNGAGTGDDKWWNGVAWQAAVKDLAVVSTAAEGEPAYSTWRVTAGMPVGALPQGRYVLYAYAFDRGHVISTAITITAP